MHLTPHTAEVMIGCHCS